MLNPPTLLTLVHAVQQPLGRPAFAALNVEHGDRRSATSTCRLDRVRGRTDPQELAPITAWRRLGETSAYLMGALRVHGASTAKVDLLAEWADPGRRSNDNADPSMQPFSAPVDELPLPRPREGYLRRRPERRPAARRLLRPRERPDRHGPLRRPRRAAPRAPRSIFVDAAPKHEFNDTKHHRVATRAIATSRYREYFDQNGRTSTSRGERRSRRRRARVGPSAARRASSTSCRRSAGSGRPTPTSSAASASAAACGSIWSGPGFRRARASCSASRSGTAPTARSTMVTRDKFKPYFTQWGMDPIWQTGGADVRTRHPPLPGRRRVGPQRLARRERRPARHGKPGLVDVVGFAPQFDEARGCGSPTSRSTWPATRRIHYTRHLRAVRASGARALPAARAGRRAGLARGAGRVRAAHARSDRARYGRSVTSAHAAVVVSGVAPSGPLPTGPAPEKPARPTHVKVRVQKRADGGRGELDWMTRPPTPR